MCRLKEFRRANNISQNALADYLGVGQGFISQMEKGIRPIPNNVIQKLLSNADWDTSMLTGDYIEQHGGRNNIGKVVGGKVSFPDNNDDDEKIRQLLLAIERRDLQVNELIQQNKTLVEVIKNLTSK